jgi:hypothetical protein
VSGARGLTERPSYLLDERACNAGTVPLRRASEREAGAGVSHAAPGRTALLQGRGFACPIARLLDATPGMKPPAGPIWSPACHACGGRRRSNFSEFVAGLDLEYGGRSGRWRFDRKHRDSTDAGCSRIMALGADGVSFPMLHGSGGVIGSAICLAQSSGRRPPITAASSLGRNAPGRAFGECPRRWALLHGQLLCQSRLWPGLASLEWQPPRPVLGSGERQRAFRKGNGRSTRSQREERRSVGLQQPRAPIAPHGETSKSWFCGLRSPSAG